MIGRIAPGLWLGLLAVSGSVLAAAPGSPLLDRVEVSGVRSLPAEQVAEAIEVAPGDRAEKSRLDRTAENLRTLYRTRGFEQAQVQSVLKKEQAKLLLELQVNEGLPTRIASVHFVPVPGARGGLLSKEWQRIVRQLEQRISLTSGDRLDQEVIARDRRAIQEVLAEDEFIGSKVEDLRIRAAPARDSSAARWVGLEFHVDLGERVSFGFRGHRIFTTSRLTALIEEQKLLGFGKDYVGAIRKKLLEEYQGQGYVHARIEVYALERAQRGERHITYQIEEGPRVSVEQVNFDGYSVFSEKVLRERLLDRAPPAVANGYYSPRDFQKAAELLVEWIKSNGYLSAKLVTVNAVSVPSLRRPERKGEEAVRVTVYLYEGDQTILDAIRIRGARAFSSDEIAGRLGIREKEPLNLFRFSEGLEQLKAAYRSEGYLEAQISNEATDRVIRYSSENRSAEIELEISEGPRFRTGPILIDGLNQTREEVVRRELQFTEGDILREGQITETEASLRRLGLFSLVTIRLSDTPGHPDQKTVRISLQEGTPGLLATGLGVRNDLGIRVFGQIAYGNLWGRNHTVSFNAMMNRRFVDYRFGEYQAQLGYVYPWSILGDTTFRPSLTVSGTQYKYLDATTVSFASTLERRLIWRFVGLLTYSLERVKQFNVQAGSGLDPNFDNQTLRIGGITPGLRLDLRDNPLSPTRGYFGTASFEFAHPALGSQRTPYPVAYTRLQHRSDYTVPIGRNVSWYLSFRTGFERNLVSPDEYPGAIGIPFIKQFALGGVASLRGFDEQELNVRQKGIFGNLSYVNYRTQVDLPLSGALRFGPFLDAANLRTDRRAPDGSLDTNYSLFDDLRYGAGFGFRYQTPVGPVNLDWGFKLHPVPGEDVHKVYFSVGTI